MEISFTANMQEAGKKLGSFLRGRGASMHLIRRLKYLPGGLCVNGEQARTNRLLAAGDRVDLCLPPEEWSVQPQTMELEVEYESAHAMVFEKPAGLVVHPTLSHHSGTLANGYCALMQARGQAGAVFRPIGRLDANTSGLQLCAMNPYAAPLLSRTQQKSYLALVNGCLPPGPGVIDLPLLAEENSAILQCVDAAGRASVTHYQVLAANERASLVRVCPQTGRTHQIRVHFAHVGHPLLGDALYGGTGPMERHALHCARLTFEEPDEGFHTLESHLPADMRQAALDLELPLHRVKL